jgi:antitoxin component of RelBE/YafQ-DinJ toxin-antitoxin module
MNAKLTLTVDKRIVEQAKQYAKQEGRSLSNLIESYLRSLVSETDRPFEFSPIVHSLKGAIKVTDPDFDYDYDSLLEAELLGKYLSDNKD